MDIPIILEGKTVGNCVLEERGLYWYLEAACMLLTDRVERLYCGACRLGVLEREGNILTLRRRLSKSAYPELPPVSGVLSLRPVEEVEPWTGTIFGYELTGFRVGQTLLFPYEAEKPCPCEPLFCFFEIKDGFWKLPLPQENGKR